MLEPEERMEMKLENPCRTIVYTQLLRTLQTFGILETRDQFHV